MKETVFFEDKWLTGSDLKLHYLDWGNSGAATMLLLHGLCCEAHYWDFFARNMRQDYHVIALNQRGHGESSWSGNYTLEQYADDLAGFVDGLALNGVVLIGHSQGALIAILYAGAHPEKVARLVLVDNGPEINMKFVGKVQKGLANLSMVFNSEDEAMRQIPKLESRRYSDEYKQNLVKHTLKRDGFGRLIFKYDPFMRHSELVNVEWLWPYMKNITCPILVVRGIESPLLLPEGARKMVDTLPNVSLVEIENTGHFVMGDNPDAFEAAVRDFLNSNTKQ